MVSCTSGWSPPSRDHQSGPCRPVPRPHLIVSFPPIAVCSQPLTTPEEAHAFLASMRDKSHQRDFLQPAPGQFTGNMDSWYLQQREREQELRRRRAEAEALLRGYRGGRESIGASVSRGGARDSLAPDLQMVDMEGFPSSQFIRHTASSQSETLDDPRSFKSNRETPALQPSFSSNPSESGDPAKEAKDENGEPTVWLDFISSEPGARFPPAKGRYHLYLSYACPGSHRVLIVRALKGLEDVITVTYLHPTWRLTKPEDVEDKHRGWVFGDPDGEPFSNTIQRGGPFPAVYPGNEPDPLFGAQSIRDMYDRAGDTAGKYTIPLLWDTEGQTIVNNESSDIAYMLNSCFNDFATNPSLDLYTECDQEGVAKLSEVSEWLSPLMIHGVYRCGFAKNQRAYGECLVHTEYDTSRCHSIEDRNLTFASR